MQPKFDLNKIKFSTDRGTFEKAAGLYEGDKVKGFKDEYGEYSAAVLGGNLYHVLISAKNFNRGNCDCYLGQNDYLCKHMVALAIYSVLRGKPMKAEEKEYISGPRFSEKTGELSKEKILEIKKEFSEALKHIKNYNGPSKIWFAYQAALSEGCNRLAAIVSDLPASRQTAELLVKLLLRLDRKISCGVDDSDGTVGGFMEETVGLLRQFAAANPDCLVVFKRLKGEKTCFGWEDQLLEMLGKP